MNLKPLIFLILAVLVILNSGCGKTPPSPEIVATYDGGTITTEELRKELHETMPRCEQDYLCPEHELNHALCSQEEKCEKYCPHHEQFETPRIFKTFIENIVLNKMAEKYAKKKKIDKKSEFEHIMKHIDEEISLSNLHSRIDNKELKAGEIEIQKYYEEHRQEFSAKTFTEVKEKIQQRLRPKIEQDYITNYIKELEENAFVTKNYQLLTSPQPLESEIWEYYQKNKDKFYQREMIEKDQIILKISDDEKKVKQKAEKALQLLRSGEDWSRVARDYSKEKTSKRETGPVKVERGSRSKAFEENVFNLNPGEISNVFKEGNSFFIVRLKEKFPGRQKELVEVKEQIKETVQEEKERAYYEENKGRTLFTIHGEPYTLGVFLEELQELAPEEAHKYTTIEAKKELLDRMISRLVLVEAARDEVSTPQKEELSEKTRTAILRQMLHQEEVDDKIEISDQETEKFYQRNKLRYCTPTRVKISYIRISQGETKEEKKKVKTRIGEVCEKLKPSWSRKGIDFASVAKEYSQDPNADQGGMVDRWFMEGEDLFEELSLHPLHEVIFNLAVRGISEPFEFRNSWWIVKVDEREEGRTLNFDEIKDRVKDDLRNNKHEELTFRMEKELLKKANLVIYNSTVKSILKEEKSKFQLSQKDESKPLTRE